MLRCMAAEAAGHLVQLEFAAQPDLTVHADRLALRAVLSELVEQRHAPCALRPGLAQRDNGSAGGCK